MADFTTIRRGHVRRRFGPCRRRRCVATRGGARTHHFVVVHSQRRPPLAGRAAGMARKAIIGGAGVGRRLERLDVRIAADVAANTRTLHLSVIHQERNPVGIGPVARAAEVTGGNMRYGLATRIGAIVAGVTIAGVYRGVIKLCRFPRRYGMAVVALLRGRNMGERLTRRFNAVVTTVTHP